MDLYGKENKKLYNALSGQKRQVKRLEEENKKLCFEKNRLRVWVRFCKEENKKMSHELSDRKEDNKKLKETITKLNICGECKDLPISPQKMLNPKKMKIKSNAHLLDHSYSREMFCNSVDSIALPEVSHPIFINKNLRKGL